MPELNLNTPVDDVFLVGKVYAGRLKKLGIRTVEDLLRHYPFRYEDFTVHSKIISVQAEEVVTITGKVVSIKNIYTKHGKKIQTARVSDETGTLEIIWYNQPFLTKIIKTGQILSLSGKIVWGNRKLVMESPVYEFIKPIPYNPQFATIHTGRLVPVYPETEGVSSKWLRSRIAPLLRNFQWQFREFLPFEIINRNHLLAEQMAIQQIHFPSNTSLAAKARERLAFDELFLLQFVAIERKNAWQKHTLGQRFDILSFKKDITLFIQSLPFELTQDQNKALNEILHDLGKSTPMNRLLEGEVGSGKTVVATIAMYLAYLNKFKSILMAPTEILARQHFDTVSSLLSPFNIKVTLITGSTTDKNRQPITDSHIYIGTHALLSEKLKYKNLGLIVIDEQQRFGVNQRYTIKGKGQNPHLLTMTATPIPRTVALTLYGELDLSLLNELPQKRKRVKTWVVPLIKREAAYRWIEKELHEVKSQAFIICPLIDESESLKAVRAVKDEFEKLKTFVFPHLSLGLLHGRLKINERQKILEHFRSRKIDILVATPIVEVGIDIPNAAIMLIEAADRFGLTQLHQLRGRVGRGDKQGYCLLFTETENEFTLKRLKTLETNFIGSRLAELDLSMRGPGEIYGTRQHGFGSQLKIADLEDKALLEKTRFEAEKLYQSGIPVTKGSPLQQSLEKYTIKNTTRD